MRRQHSGRVRGEGKFKLSHHPSAPTQLRKYRRERPCSQGSEALLDLISVLLADLNPASKTA